MLIPVCGVGKNTPKSLLEQICTIILASCTASYRLLVLNVCMYGSNSEAASHVQLCAALAGISS